MKRYKKYQFLFEELVKRDFKKKYKRTVLGMFWSLLAPLLNLLVLTVIFKFVFGRSQPHFMIYVFCGTLIMNYYTEATNGGMRALIMNAAIFSKINMPKEMFVLSKNAQALINYLLTAIIFVVFCLIDGIHVGPHMLILIVPTILLTVMQIGIGLILSAGYVLFRDIEYLYSVFLTLLNYASAVFYPVDIIPAQYQQLLLANPVYVFINYFRMVTIDGVIPSLDYHLLCVLDALLFLLIGWYIYRRYDHEFIYYI